MSRDHRFTTTGSGSRPPDPSWACTRTCSASSMPPMSVPSSTRSLPIRIRASRCCDGRDGTHRPTAAAQHAGRRCRERCRPDDPLRATRFARPAATDPSAVQYSGGARPRRLVHWISGPPLFDPPPKAIELMKIVSTPDGDMYVYRFRQEGGEWLAGWSGPFPHRGPVEIYGGHTGTSHEQASSKTAEQHVGVQ